MSSSGRAAALLAACLAMTTAQCGPLAARQSGPQSLDSLSAGTLALVEQRLAESSSDSWENGTWAQAVLEYHYPQYAPFSSKQIVPVSTGTMGSPVDIIEMAHVTMAQKTNATLMLCPDGSAGDPASLGIPIMIANASNTSINYWWAIEQQNTYLFRVAPRTRDGAVSHRTDEVQLWSDFISMVPPYLAYHGALTNNDSTMLAAYDQIAKYRAYLTNGTNLWRHIVLGDYIDQDLEYWATGNAWAAWGMARVLATMRSSSYSNKYQDQQTNLKNWIVGTLTESYYSLNRTTNLLNNYFGQRTFSEAAATALMAATSYRMAQMGLDSSTIPSADLARRAVYAGVNQATGWLSPVVDPYDWGSEGQQSPEGQAFVLILAAAHRDYLNATGQSNNTDTKSSNPSSAARPTSVPSFLPLAFLVALAFLQKLV